MILRDVDIFQRDVLTVLNTLGSKFGIEKSFPVATLIISVFSSERALNSSEFEGINKNVTLDSLRDFLPILSRSVYSTDGLIILMPLICHVMQKKRPTEESQVLTESTSVATCLTILKKVNLVGIHFI